MDVSEAPTLDSATAENSEVNTGIVSQPNAESSSTSNNARGVKRQAADDIEERSGKRTATDASGDEHEDGEEDEDEHEHGDGNENEDQASTTMSKSQLKKLRRKQQYEAQKTFRRLKRREKRRERSEHKREQKEEEIAAAAAEGREPVIHRPKPPKRGPNVPVAIIVDCQFEKYMLEQELVSLTSQVTRCYSDNKNAQHPVHLYVSSYGGYMKERQETVLENQHVKWKGIHFSTADFVETAQEAKKAMAKSKGDETFEQLQLSRNLTDEPLSLTPPSAKAVKKAKVLPTPELEAEDVDKSIVYLTADSPYTLNCLEPNTCYVVGGIIDKNREKGLCYKIARERNVRTAKLPIGEYMVLQHRHILATNHVVEIMLKWLELGDWGAAFMKVIPTRKGGKLKSDEDDAMQPAEGEQGEEQTAKETTKEAGNDNTPHADVQDIAVTQSEAQDTPKDPNGNNVTEVEGDNAEEGLQNNTLAKQTWSTPPPEVETAVDGQKELASGTAS